MCEISEWRFESKEQGRRHDKSESIHGEVVVNTMKKEMEHESPRTVREIVVDVE